MKKVKNLIKSLNSNKFLWPLVAILGSLKKSIQNKKIQLLWRDIDGDWINIQKDITLYSPEISVDTFEEITQKVNKYFLYTYSPKSGDTIIDVGAGIGEDIVYFSKKIGSTGKAIAIEANPNTFRCLKKTVKKNELQNVICLNVACTSKSEVVEISGDLGYLSNTLFTNSQKKESLSVDGKTLDSIIEAQKLGDIDFIKINIEGAELDALEGASNVIKSKTSFAVSCHDFKYNEGKGEYFRTFKSVKKIFESHGRQVKSKDTQERELAYYLYT